MVVPPELSGDGEAASFVSISPNRDAWVLIVSFLKNKLNLKISAENTLHLLHLLLFLLPPEQLNLPLPEEKKKKERKKKESGS